MLKKFIAVVGLAKPNPAMTTSIFSSFPKFQMIKSLMSHLLTPCWLGVMGPLKILQRFQQYVLKMQCLICEKPVRWHLQWYISLPQNK